MGKFIETSEILAKAIEEAYMRGESDYYMKPLVLKNADGKSIGLINDGDSVVFCCKRGEREIQLTDCFVEPEFTYFERKNFSNLFFVPFTLYHSKYVSLNLPIAFKFETVSNTLGEVISRSKLKQLRIAESEKIAHVTFFFNGGENIVFPLEDDVKIPSHRGIPYEKIPLLKLSEVSARLIEEINKDKYNFILANFANGDIIGHTSDFDAKVTCVKGIDKTLEDVVTAAIKQKYTVMITADHGVLEVGYKDDGRPNVSHTTNPVPFLLVGPSVQEISLREGRLANVASTVLVSMGIEPPEIFEKSLFRARTAIKQRKVLLIVLDGWGIGKEDSKNPIYVAGAPFYNRLLREYPHTILKASGEDVGLKKDQPGNSEAGHINLGAGRVVLQDDVIIEKSIADGSFFKNPVLLEAVNRLHDSKGCLHLIGLLSHKSSHGVIDYVSNVLMLARSQNLENAYLHIILDGRSTEPGSAPHLLRQFGVTLREMGIGTIVTVFGRGIALDRSGDYLGKTKLAYDAMVFGKGEPVYWRNCEHEEKEVRK